MTNYHFDSSFEFAQLLDQQDELAKYKQEFYIPTNRIYLDGNSLGMMSKRAENSVLTLLNSWKDLQIEGWTQGENPWFFISEDLGQKMAPIVGALPEEVIVTGSTTVNLHQLVASFYQPKGKKTKIIATELDFPTDLYVLQSQLSLHGYHSDEHLILIASNDQKTIAEEDIIAAMTEEVALIILPTVLYRSGQLLDIPRLTKEAHKRGILIGFDACHSAGLIPHQFSDWDVDFAVWCNYKYLNGGPGCVGSLYVNKKHLHTTPGLTGWYSSNKDIQFDMPNTLTPAKTAGAFQLGTPHVLSLAPLLGSLDIFAEASIHRIYEKSKLLTSYMLHLINDQLAQYQFTIATPATLEQRGGHISLEHDEAVRINKALIANNIIADFRAPNILRLAPMALYTSFEEVWRTIETLKKIMSEKQYEQFDSVRNVVA